MTFDQWIAEVAKDVFLASNEDPEVKDKVLDTVDEDLMDEEA